MAKINIFNDLQNKLDNFIYAFYEFQQVKSHTHPNKEQIFFFTASKAFDTASKAYRDAITPISDEAINTSFDLVTKAIEDFDLATMYMGPIIIDRKEYNLYCENADRHLKYAIWQLYTVQNNYIQRNQRSFSNKYLKYKTKYLQLKNKI